jgi:hypothetical protein
MGGHAGQKVELSRSAVTKKADETGHRKLAQRLRENKVVVKLFLRHPLHAKLYLLFRPDPINPIIGYVGSSNLTMAAQENQPSTQYNNMRHAAHYPNNGLFGQMKREKRPHEPKSAGFNTIICITPGNSPACQGRTQQMQ